MKEYWDSLEKSAKIRIIALSSLIIMACAGTSYIKVLTSPQIVQIDTQGQPYDGRGFILRGTIESKTIFSLNTHCRFLLKTQTDQIFTGELEFPGEPIEKVKNEQLDSFSGCW